LAIRTALPPSTIVASVRETLRAIDAGITPVDIQTMEQRVSESTSRRRFQTALLVAFAVLAVSLALVGLYGLLSYSVNQRAPEIGVRMALGATRPKVLCMVVRWGLTLTAAGLAFGLASAFAVTRFTASMLYGVSATDPETFVMVPALIMVVAAAACFAPAWKATRIDPVAALREQ
jgi:ABC-type antimicrobial peptide transport system permease subunit